MNRDLAKNWKEAWGRVNRFQLREEAEAYVGSKHAMAHLRDLVELAIDQGVFGSKPLPMDDPEAWKVICTWKKLIDRSQEKKEA